MPRFVELGLNRIFRSRWGVAIVLVAVVGAIVGIGRLLSGGGSDSPSFGIGSPAPAISVNPSDDDGVIDSAPPPSPAASPRRAQPQAEPDAFGSAGANHKRDTPNSARDRPSPNPPGRPSARPAGALAGARPAEPGASRPDRGK